MTSQTLNGSKLKSIATATNTAAVTMDALSHRERHRQYSDISKTRKLLLRSNQKIVDEDYKRFWKDLETAGIGSVVYGRKGKADRFEWYYSIKSVTKAGLTGADEKVKREAVSPIVVENAPAVQSSKPVAKLPALELKQAYSLYLMPLNDVTGAKAEVLLPTGITPHELKCFKEQVAKL